MNTCFFGRQSGPFIEGCCDGDDGGCLNSMASNPQDSAHPIFPKVMQHVVVTIPAHSHRYQLESGRRKKKFKGRARLFGPLLGGKVGLRQNSPKPRLLVGSSEVRLLPTRRTMPFITPSDNHTSRADTMRDTAHLSQSDSVSRLESV